MQDLKRCKLGSAEPADSLSARPFALDAEIRSTAVAAEPHIAQVPAPTSPAGPVSSMPPGAFLHANDNSTNHYAATED